MIKIHHRYDSNKILHEVEAATTIAEAVTKLVKEGADLSGADLSGADLRSADLRSADLYGADLRSADLRSADLYGANLRSANLYGANLTGANLTGANLYGAYLRSANLRGAYLSGAYLSGANLRGADLYGADLRSAYLRSVNLYGADLRSAYLSGAYLSGADLRSADLSGAKGLGAFKVCAPEGPIVGWKKICGGQILRLEIPADAQRVNAIGSRKCRASAALVTGVYSTDKQEIKEPGDLISKHKASFTYRVGEVCTPDRFEPSDRIECAPGIHFFITFEEAVEYD